MEDNNDEKHFEFLVYSQGEPNQYAKMQARLAYAEKK